MDANDIITVTFTDNLARQTIIIDMAQPEYVAVLGKVTALPAAIQDDTIGLGVYTVTATPADGEVRDHTDSGCCDDCGKEHTSIWSVDDSAGWLCVTCLIEQAAIDAIHEQEFVKLFGIPSKTPDA